MPPYVRHRTRSIPLNAARNGRDLGLQCSIFALTKSEHCQLTARPIELMGLIATSLFGTRGFPCSHPGSPPTTRISFVYYVYLILLAGSKSVVINICEIKYLKHMILCKAWNGVNPAKRGLERITVEPTMLNSCPGAERASPAHRSTCIPKKETAVDPRGELGCSPFVRAKIKYCGLDSCLFEAVFSGIDPVLSLT